MGSSRVGVVTQMKPAQQMPSFCPCRNTETGILQLIASQYLAALIVGFVNSATVQPILALERPVMYREMGAGSSEHSWTDSCTSSLCLHCSSSVVAPHCLSRDGSSSCLSIVASCTSSLFSIATVILQQSRQHVRAALACTIICSSSGCPAPVLCHRAWYEACWSPTVRAAASLCCKSTHAAGTFGWQPPEAPLLHCRACLRRLCAQPPHGQLPEAAHLLICSWIVPTSPCTCRHVQPPALCPGPDLH